MNELAEYLKSERLARGLALQDISQKARISVNMLQILEEGDYERIGTALLIRSFVRAYCEALEVDPDPLLERYEAEILACDRQAESIRKYGTWSKSIHVTRRLGFLALLILVALLIAALWGGVWLYNKKVRMAESDKTAFVYPQQEYPADLQEGLAPRGKVAVRDSQKEPDTNATVDAPPVVTAKQDQELDVRGPEVKPRELSPHRLLPDTGNPSIVMAEESPPGTPQDPDHAPRMHRLEMVAEQKTWVQVKIDDDKTSSALLQPGDERQWETRQGMSVVVGNAGGVRMKWDGKTIGADGKPGQVLRFRLPGSQLAENPERR